MTRYASGSEEAFEQLFARTAPLVLGYMRKGYVSLADAQDLAQQTFLQLHRARKDYKHGAPLRPWLMTIARNVKRDHFRRESRRDAFAPLLDELGREDARIERGDLGELLGGAIDRLPSTLAAVVRARWLEERDYADISRELGISVGAVKVRAHRACRALRTILSREDRPGPGRPGPESGNPAPETRVDPSGV